MEFDKINDNCYATNPILSDKHELTWKKGNYTEWFLIIQAPASEDVNIESNDFQSAINQVESQLLTDYRVAISKYLRTEVRLISAKEIKSRGDLCKLSVGTGNLQFWVFAASIVDGKLKLLVYNSKGQLLQNQVKVSAKIEIQIKEEQRSIRSGLFRSTTVVYHSIIIKTQDTFNDGDLYYVVKGYEYPVLFSMLNKPFYLNIPDSEKITFRSHQNADIIIKGCVRNGRN